MSVATQSERSFQLMPDVAEQFRRLLLAQDRDKPNTLALAAAPGADVATESFAYYPFALQVSACLVTTT